MYIIIEMQTTNGVTAVVTPIKTDTDINRALNKYYSTLAAAAVSKVEVHTVMLITGNGEVVRVERFEHATETEVGE